MNSDSQTKMSLTDTQEDRAHYHALVMSLIERNRWLNRDAVEAVEKTQRFIDSIGGFDALTRMQRLSLEAEHNG